ncbi:hypothetical protein [Portibacter lacus]|uniref:Uncharacterized protein n=1 Tax=Portibacter lacus TaxID=1099794 RepID=A0AA37SNH9_9BACT|nr:hypothetical protein [Portibacter lacus]GLR16329.1 hypothetical protein GCM10007940_09440 [Portibacter lacus]
MSTLFTDPDALLDHQPQDDTVGAAYGEFSDDGYSIMPPENQFSTQPLETGGKLDEKAIPENTDSDKEETGTWTTPREREEISTKSAATIKLHQIKVHINYLLDLWEKSGDISKKPESLDDLVNLTSDCDEMMKIINEGDSDNEKLYSSEVQVLNEISGNIETSYGDAIGLIIGQSQKAAKNIGNIPDLSGVDGSLKELIRQNFGDKNQEELDNIMYSLEGSKEYHRIVGALKKAAWNVVGEVGGVIWAEGLKKLEDFLSKALEEFKSHGEYLISFVSGLIDVFGIDESDSVDGMRKTFDLIDTIVGNPFSKALVPLWTAYRPAINFCLDGIDMIKKQRDESLKDLGIAQGLIQHVKKNNQNKIRSGMTLGLPGISVQGKLDLLLFMMDMHAMPAQDAFKVPVKADVKTFFENNQDLINAGGKERIGTNYNNPLNPFDNEIADIASNVYVNRGDIWVMLYGTMLTPPRR